MGFVKTLRLIKGTSLTYQELDESQAGAHLVSEGTHTKTVHEVVRPTSPTAWTEAQADSTTNIGYGLVFNVPDADSFWVLVDPAFITKTTHGWTGELWLSQSTAGLITDTRPTSGVIQRIGQVIDANTYLWYPMMVYIDV